MAIVLRAGHVSRGFFGPNDAPQVARRWRTGAAIGGATRWRSRRHWTAAAFCRSAGAAACCGRWGVRLQADDEKRQQALAITHKSASLNPEGIASSSPGLRGTSYPRYDGPNDNQPQRAC